MTSCLGRQFPDSVCAGTPKGHYHPYIEKGREHVWNGIPYRPPLPQKIEGLLVAGRCFSSHESYRGHPDMPICMAMGQAAGTAAAMAVADNVAPRQVMFRGCASPCLSRASGLAATLPR